VQGELQPRKLIDCIVETVYDCSTLEDDVVQLHVIKVLLTAVTSVNCQVHDHSLLLAIRACYHIYLMSRHAVNQSTAKATLTQMSNIVLQRMEHFGGQVRALAFFLHVFFCFIFTNRVCELADENIPLPGSNY
jgi:brefeldin A-inhibited guanine nucleotide-exchange protein